MEKFFWVPTAVFHGIACCVTHLCVKNSNQQSAISLQKNDQLTILKLVADSFTAVQASVATKAKGMYNCWSTKKYDMHCNV